MKTSETKTTSTAKKKGKININWTSIIVVLSVYAILGGTAGTAYFLFRHAISEMSGGLINKADIPQLEVPELVIDEDEANESSEEAPKETTEKSEEPEPEAEVESTPPTSEGLKFHLAAGSFTAEQNARDLVKQLKSQGYDAVYLGRIGEYYKVSYQSFNNKADAKSALQSLKDKGVSSWVLKHELN